ncbi:sigma-70 family RNA polymerase sigma factor [Sphingomonadales bacterium 56]|uniref:RNA polymerase sigma factor n=1 Tax=unclassified Sphingobium TaxID=2611147 RepID=UPI00191A12E6|nr:MULTISPECIES: sigma-70 family RNA polymerase sigma factor [unclassified Sphingobium]MBY2927952.1 sigma-70 family RNA polymerase sigma factor [Sphingomonadales bacterium 56]MBY2958052.1 sigma-70 family RNA polymerase sigma factor [Sphingomonadales bacterium 58]
MHRVRAKLDWFKTVILPQEAALRGRLRRILPSTHELDDMVAEVMARAFATENWENVTTGRAYLFTIARNLVIDNARRNKVVSFETIADLELLQGNSNVEAQLHAREALRQIEAIVESLPPQCRRVFILRRIHERSMLEIAAEMSLSVSTVEKHLAKAIAIVMRAWSEREETDFERASVGARITKQGRGRGGSRAPAGKA